MQQNIKPPSFRQLLSTRLAALIGAGKPYADYKAFLAVLQPLSEGSEQDALYVEMKRGQLNTLTTGNATPSRTATEALAHALGLQGDALTNFRTVAEEQRKKLGPQKTIGTTPESVNFATIIDHNKLGETLAKVRAIPSPTSPPVEASATPPQVVPKPVEEPLYMAPVVPQPTPLSPPKPRRSAVPHKPKPASPEVTRSTETNNPWQGAKFAFPAYRPADGYDTQQLNTQAVQFYQLLTGNASVEDIYEAIGRQRTQETIRNWQAKNTTLDVEALLPVCDVLAAHIFPNDQAKQRQAANHMAGIPWTEKKNAAELIALAETQQWNLHTLLTIARWQDRKSFDDYAKTLGYLPCKLRDIISGETTPQDASIADMAKKFGLTADKDIKTFSAVCKRTYTPPAKDKAEACTAALEAAEKAIMVNKSAHNPEAPCATYDPNALSAIAGNLYTALTQDMSGAEIQRVSNGRIRSVTANHWKRGNAAPTADGLLKGCDALAGALFKDKAQAQKAANYMAGVPWEDTKDGNAILALARNEKLNRTAMLNLARRQRRELVGEYAEELHISSGDLSAITASLSEALRYTHRLPKNLDAVARNFGLTKRENIADFRKIIQGIDLQENSPEALATFFTEQYNTMGRPAFFREFIRRANKRFGLVDRGELADAILANPFSGNTIADEEKPDIRKKLKARLDGLPKKNDSSMVEPRMAEWVGNYIFHDNNQLKEQLVNMLCPPKRTTAPPVSGEAPAVIASLHAYTPSASCTDRTPGT